MKVYTIGHSTRSLEDFLKILKKFRIEVVIDVRRFPSSKKFPWFNKEILSKALRANNIEYIHFEKLGGYRKEGYLNFTKTKEFKNAIQELIQIISKKTSVIMCSELLWFRCHRKFIAQKLVELGFKVIHVFDEKRQQEHKLKNKEINIKMGYVVWCDKKARKFARLKNL